METKFIDNTNKQYSIREDGVIISNYMDHYSSLTKSLIRKYRVKELKPNKDGKINFRVGGRNGQSKVLTISKLMKEYYNGVKCHRCDNMITKKYSKVFNNCATEIIKKAEKNRIHTLSKSYVANLVGFKVSEFTDELYENYKAILLVKRKLAEKLNTKPQYI
jgi:hypothetical protein